MINDDVLINDWVAVARSANVVTEKLIPVVLLEQEVVLWRSADGGIHAWEDRCVHRGVKLSLGHIYDDKVICAYHSWNYNCKGKCVAMPAHPGQKPPEKAQVNQYTVKEAYGFVWVSLGDPKHDVPPFPQEFDEDYTTIFSGCFDVHSSAPRIIENFLDMAHFPYVHPGRLGSVPFTEVKDYDVDTTEAGIVASNCRFTQPRGSLTCPDPQEITYTYRVPRPLTAILEKEAEDGGKATDVIMLTVTPIDQENSIAWMYCAVNYIPEDGTAEDVTAFHGGIFAEDLPILEAQRPRVLPLDLSAELHQRCDQTSIAYRRWLSELGMSYGTTAYQSS